MGECGWRQLLLPLQPANRHRKRITSCLQPDKQSVHPKNSAPHVILEFAKWCDLVSWAVEERLLHASR